MANTALYGFHNLADVKNEVVNDGLIPVVTDAVEAARVNYNRELDAAQGLFAEVTTDYKERVKTASAARLQPLDENGRARPVKALGHFDVAYPIKKAGIAEGNTYEAGVLRTVADVEQITTTLLIADSNWMMDQLLAAAYNNADWTYSDDRYGDLTIKPIANGDAATYHTVTTAGAGSTQSNLLAQAATLADATNGLNTLAKQLRKFPGQNGPGAQIISFLPTNLIDEAMGLAGFKDATDPNIQTGANTDILRTSGPGVPHPGILRGYDKVSRTWIVEWERLADDYAIQVVTTGPRPLARREYADARLRGFVRIGDRNDIPYFERQYGRWAGFGARNRTAMGVIRFGNASYAIPANYNPATMA